jgi:hypothetical protein
VAQTGAIAGEPVAQTGVAAGSPSGAIVQG